MVKNEVSVKSTSFFVVSGKSKDMSCFPSLYVTMLEDVNLSQWEA